MQIQRHKQDNRGQSRADRRNARRSERRNARQQDRQNQNIQNIDDFNSSDTPPRPSVAATIGDIGSGLVEFLLDPNTLMMAGYSACALCIGVSTYGYANVFVPLLQATMPAIAATTGGLLGFAIAAYMQYNEIKPNLAKYDANRADKVAFKLGLTSFVDPSGDKDSPTLLPDAKRWARNSAKNAQQEGETASMFCYLVETIGAIYAFSVFTAGGINLAGLLLAVIAVRGFEEAYKFASQQKALRLTGKEHKIYKSLRKGKERRARASIS